MFGRKMMGGMIIVLWMFSIIVGILMGLILKGLMLMSLWMLNSDMLGILI